MIKIKLCKRGIPQRIIANLLTVLFLSGMATLAAAEGNCWVVGIAMNSESPKLIDAWNDYGVQFTKVFSQNAGTLYGKVQSRAIVGRDVTRANVLNAINWLSQNARPKDLVAIYITCHGATEPRTGWSISTVDNKEITGKDIKSVVGKMPCPVLCVIDTCESGGFARPHKEDVPLPPNCTAICSSRAKQGTTNHLNVALHEALWGKADANGDGFVELGETVTYIQARAKEMLEVKEGGDGKKEGELPIIVRADSMAPDLKLLKTSNKLVALAHGKEWYLGTVLKETGDKCQVHVMGWSEDPASDYFLFNEIDKSKVFTLNKGDPLPVKVDDNGNKKLALLLGNEGDKLKVQYLNKRKTGATVEKSQVEYLFVEDTNEQTQQGGRRRKKT